MQTRKFLLAFMIIGFLFISGAVSAQPALEWKRFAASPGDKPSLILHGFAKDRYVRLPRQGRAGDWSASGFSLSFIYE